MNYDCIINTYVFVTYPVLTGAIDPMLRTTKSQIKSHGLNSSMLCCQAGILKVDIAGSSRFFRCSKPFQHGPGARYIALDIYLKAMRTLSTWLEKGHVFTQMFQAFSTQIFLYRAAPPSFVPRAIYILH